MIKLNLILLLLLFSLGTGACASYGTEVGSPGSTRTVTGSVASETTTTTSLLYSSSTDSDDDLNEDALFVQGSGSASCPDANGAIEVVLKDRDQVLFSATVDNQGAFSVSALQNDRYEIVFKQQGVQCGYLVYGNDQHDNGLRVTLGKGSQDVSMGSITDLGGGIFVASNDPSGFCDDDGDGINDNDDDDDDGDGRSDRDGDYDGYIDWFDDNDDNDRHPPDQDGACRVVYIYPSESSGLPLDGNGDARVKVYFDRPIVSVDLTAIQVKDSNGAVILNGVDSANSEITQDERDTVLNLDLTLTEDQDYELVIPADTVTCDKGTSFDVNLGIEFFTL